MLTDDNQKLIYRSDETLKQFLPIYLSRIRKHYGSSVPRKTMHKLLPRGTSSINSTDMDEELKSTIIDVSPSVVSVSYFSGVQRKVDCTGFIIHWDDAKGVATVLTSAKLMRSPSKRDNYYIVVRLANGNILLAEEHYVDYYHNIVTFKVNSDVKLEPLKFHSHSQETSEEVVALSRNFYTCRLSESKGLIRENYPYFGCEELLSSTCSGSQVGEGGPLINKMGHVCGINFFDGHHYVHPLPSSVINSCLENWNANGIVKQPWFGFTLIDSTNLPIDAYETLRQNRSSNAVVKEVYKGSPADIVGVSPGDFVTGLVTHLNDHLITCPRQYARLLITESNLLSSCHPDDDVTKFYVCVNDDRMVYAENLNVNDKKFCSCWLGDESDWTFMEPLIGSQRDAAYDIGMNTNVSLEPLGFVTDTDTGINDDVPIYSAWRYM